MLIDYVLGQTGVILRVKVRNSSVSTGAGLTGLTNASAGMIISTICDNESAATAYTVAGSTIDAVTTLGTYSAPAANHCAFKEVDATNHKGVVEIQIANARFATAGAKSMIVSLSGAVNMVETDVTIPLRAVNPYSASAFMTGVNGLAPPTNWNALGITAAGKITEVALCDVVTTLTGYSTPPTAAAIAAVILATPANLLATDGTGKVGANNLPTDYQQRAIAVTLPTTPPAGYGSSSDPWTTALPGAYGAGSAGAILAGANTAALAVQTAVNNSQTAFAVVADGANSTTVLTVSGLALAGSYVGMLAEFTSGTASNLKTRQTISAQTTNGANLKLTFSAPFGTAPAAGDAGQVL